MAMSPSPQISPTMGIQPRIDRQRSNSPLPLPQQTSKRDKRRNMIFERFHNREETFSADKDVHYREQLLAIQIAMSLITEADVHGSTPLPDTAEEIDRLVADTYQKNLGKDPGADIPLRAGKLYSEFAKEINAAMEEKDTVLTTHRKEYDDKKTMLRADNIYLRKLAQHEYRALSTTTRDRLINSVNMKKNRLFKDKETLDIGETNAFLLHPSQFGVANPTSPGGFHAKRTTRHRRDGEDFPSITENKRKRKAGESDESPAPIRQRMDNGTSTPIWMAERAHNTAIQIESSLYSIEKLFSEKELAMTYNAAALAAHSYIIRHPPYDEDEDLPNGKSESSSDNGKPNGHGDNDDNPDGDSPPSGATMERTTSHAARSTRGGGAGIQPAPNYGNSIGGVERAADLNIPSNMDDIAKQVPKLPPIGGVPSKLLTRGENANQPSGLTLEESAVELDIIKRASAFNTAYGPGKNLESESGGKSLLQNAMKTGGQSGDRSSRGMQQAAQGQIGAYSALREDVVVDLMGGEPLSKQSSRGGAGSERGGTPMSRQGTNEGTLPMPRGRRGRLLG